MSLDTLRREIAELDKAEWVTWPHAYGSARDTPGHLSALLGDDPEAQRKAVLYFSGAIVHQTSVWPASPDAFDWLIRVLRVAELPDDELWRCLEALAEAAEYLREDPGPVLRLSREARGWLRKFARKPDDEHEFVWAEFLQSEQSDEVYNWVLARMATLRPAVRTLVDELNDRAPTACAAVRKAWLAR